MFMPRSSRTATPSILYSTDGRLYVLNGAEFNTACCQIRSAFPHSLHMIHLQYLTRIKFA